MKRKPIKFENLKVCGIYCILCLPTNEMYIGSSRDIYNRWRSHRQSLNNGDHHNSHLQNAWNKYGEDQFNFSVLDFCELDKQFELEQYYIDSYKAYERGIGFNIARIAALPPMTLESRKLQGESLKKNTEFIDYCRNFLIEKHKDPNFSAMLIESVKNSPKVKANLKALNESPEHKKQVQELLDMVHNDPKIQDMVKNLAKSNVKKDSWRASHGMRTIVKVDITTRKAVAEFTSLCEIERSGISRFQVADCCKGKRDSYKGFKWMYLEDYRKLQEE